MTNTNSNKNYKSLDDTRETDKNFTFNLLRSHNAYRKRHGAGILKWDSELAKTAQEAAEDAAHSNTLRSVDMNNVGQNMAAMTGGELTGERVTAMWYDEEQKYDYNKPGFSSSTGSFTQLVWQGTEKIGVGRAFGPQGQTFIIALYSPPGNIRGRYETNVGRPSGPIPVIKPTGQKNEKTCCAIL